MEGFPVSQETFGSRSTRRAKKAILASKFPSVALAFPPALRPAFAVHEMDFTRKLRGIKRQVRGMKKLQYVREMREMRMVCHAFFLSPCQRGTVALLRGGGSVMNASIHTPLTPALRADPLPQGARVKRMGATPFTMRKLNPLGAEAPLPLAKGEKWERGEGEEGRASNRTL